MLVLTRKVGEGIAVGDDVKIVVMQIKGKQVRLGIKASPKTVVHREEIFQKIQEENHRAAVTTPESLDGVADNFRSTNIELKTGNAPLRRQQRVDKGN